MRSNVKRPATIVFKVTAEERQLAEHLAASRDLTISQVLRAALRREAAGLTPEVPSVADPVLGVTSP
jgi:hypothetical protein